jgi:outer membrane protein assembly factor BamA
MAAYRILVSILALTWPATIGAQDGQPSAAQLPESSKKLIAINVTGSKRFAAQDVIAASGLRLGIIAGDEDFKKAARQLGDTGAFSDIAYSYAYSSDGTKLDLKLRDAEKFVPARFEDFVWFTGEQLRKIIKDYVPLFDGDLPLSGNMAGQVSDVLQARLVEKGVAGHVEYVRYAQDDGPVEAIDYSVADVAIQIRKILFAGVGASELPLLEAAGQKMPERGYSRARLKTFVEHDLLPIYQARGYLKAVFGTPEPKVVSSAAADAADDERHITLVDVTLPVTPGEQYKLSRLDWSGAQAFPTEKLDSMIHMPIGEPADTVRLGIDLANVRNLYGSKGYITAIIKADAKFDDAAATVAIMLRVNEGSVFHMGDLEFRGLDNSLTAKLREAWKLRPGDLYDASYLKQYLQDAHKLLPPSQDWEVAPHVTANVRDKSVDVDLQYTVKAPR